MDNWKLVSGFPRCAKAVNVTSPINLGVYITPQLELFTGKQETVHRLVKMERRHHKAVHSALAFEQANLKRTLTWAQRSVAFQWECKVNVKELQQAILTNARLLKNLQKQLFG